jgi:hypothetical protein
MPSARLNGKGLVLNAMVEEGYITRGGGRCRGDATRTSMRTEVVQAPSTMSPTGSRA